MKTIKTTTLGLLRSNVFDIGDDGSFEDMGAPEGINSMSKIGSLIQAWLRETKNDSNPDYSLLSKLYAEVFGGFAALSDGETFEPERMDRLIRLSIQLGITYQRAILRESEALSKYAKKQRSGLKSDRKKKSTIAPKQKVIELMAKLEKENPKRNKTWWKKKASLHFDVSVRTIEKRLKENCEAQ